MELKSASSKSKRKSPKDAAAKAAPTVTASVSGPIVPGVSIITSGGSPNAAEKRARALAALESLKGSEAMSYIPEDAVDEVCPTGSIVVDSVLGLGGFPLSDKFVQIQGEEQAGKSTLMYAYAANFQRLTGEPVAILDHERTCKPFYLRGCGVDTSKDRLFLHHPMDLDESIKIVRRYSAAGVRCFIFDSVAAMEIGVSAKDIEKGEAMSSQVGEHARAFKQFLRLLRGHTRDCQCLFVNQIRDLIPTNQKDSNRIKYQTIDKPAYVVPGGRAMKFYSSLTLETMKGKTFDKVGEDDEWLFPEIAKAKEGEARHWGINRSTIRVMKNKVTAGGYRAYHFYTRPGTGVDDNISIRELARNFDLIRGNSKGWVVGALDDRAPIATFSNKEACLQAMFDEDEHLYIPLKELVAEAILLEDAKRFRYERTARDKFLAGDIDHAEAKALGVTGAVDFEAEAPGTGDPTETELE